MSEFAVFVVGIVLGIAIAIHVIRRYHNRDGMAGDIIRRALGR